MIAFSRIDMNTLRIYAIPPSGGALRALGRSFAGSWGANWSPDRSRIALYSFSTLIVLRSDGTGERRLATDAGSFDWSPDGSRLVFVSGEDLSLAVIGADGRGRRTITSGTRPGWSPDGRILFWRSYSETTHVISPNGKNERRFPVNFESEFAFSPDGARIAYMTYDPDPEVRVIDAKGRNAKRIGPASGGLSWSPDGRSVAFFTNDLRTVGITVAHVGTGRLSSILETGRLRRVRCKEHGGLEPGWLSWAPDGCYLAFATGYRQRDCTPDYAVWVIRADGSGLRRLTKTVWRGSNFAPAWVPASRVANWTQKSQPVGAGRQMEYERSTRVAG